MRSRWARDSHFYTARRWDRINLMLGLSAVMVGVVGGGSVGTGLFGALPSPVSSSLAGVFAVMAGLLAATVSFLRPSDRIEGHKRAGDKWSILRDRVATFYLVEMERTELEESTLQDAYESLLEEKAQVTEDSPVIPTWAYEKTRKQKYEPTLPRAKTQS